MYKTILVHVDADDPGAADRIQCAADLARDYHAALIGAAAGLPEAALEIIAAGAPILAGGTLTGDSRALDDRFAAARSEFARWTSGLCAQTGWRTAIDFPAAAMAKMAGIADLIVVGSHAGSALWNGSRSVDCGDLVMRAGRPVLTIPRGIAKVDLSGAVVAWKNTREARRALADALPLLARAERVTLLHVREEGEDDDASLADAKAFLNAHSIGSATRTLEVEKDGVAGRIVDFAQRSQSGLIVAGAYGHTRVREWAFGGVTRDLLKACPMACLLSR